MAEPSPDGNNSIYPRRDTLAQVEQEAIAQLPITTPNQIVTLLQLHQNTVMKVLAEDI